MIFDYKYAKQICQLMFKDEKAFKKEAKKYDKNLAKKIYQIAIDKGEDKAMPIYLKHKETYERYQDINSVLYLAMMGVNCKAMEEEGYFGKQ